MAALTLKICALRRVWIFWGVKWGMRLVMEKEMEREKWLCRKCGSRLEGIMDLVKPPGRSNRQILQHFGYRLCAPGILGKG